MYATYAVGYMIPNKAIRTAESNREPHLKIFPTIGYAPCAEWEKTIFPNNKLFEKIFRERRMRNHSSFLF